MATIGAAAESVKNSFGPATAGVGRQFEDGSLSIGQSNATGPSRSIQVPGGIGYEAGTGSVPIGTTGSCRAEAIENRLRLGMRRASVAQKGRSSQCKGKGAEWQASSADHDRLRS